MELFERDIILQLQQARLSRGMPQERLAIAVGVTRTSISNIEHGRQSLSLNLFCKISLALDLKPDEVLAKSLIRRVNRGIAISSHEVENDKIRKIIEKTVNVPIEGRRE